MNLTLKGVCSNPYGKWTWLCLHNVLIASELGTPWPGPGWFNCVTANVFILFYSVIFLKTTHEGRLFNLAIFNLFKCC